MPATRRRRRRAETRRMHAADQEVERRRRGAGIDAGDRLAERRAVRQASVGFDHRRQRVGQTGRGAGARDAQKLFGAGEGRRVEKIDAETGQHAHLRRVIGLGRRRIRCALAGS